MNNKLVAFATLLFLCCSIVPLYAQMSSPSPGYQGPVPQSPAVTPTPQAAAYEREVSGPSGEAIMADLIFVRPLSLIGLALGTVVSIVATPLALASGTTPMVYDKLVVEPYNYTVCRPLGTGF